METILLTCLQAQILIQRIIATNLNDFHKSDLILEIRQVSPQNCNLKIQ